MLRRRDKGSLLLARQPESDCWDGSCAKQTWAWGLSRAAEAWAVLKVPVMQNPVTAFPRPRLELPGR